MKYAKIPIEFGYLQCRADTVENETIPRISGGKDKDEKGDREAREQRGQQ